LRPLRAAQLAAILPRHAHRVLALLTNVRGAKARARPRLNKAPAAQNPQKRWVWGSALGQCCICVPGLLPLLRKTLISVSRFCSSMVNAALVASGLAACVWSTRGHDPSASANCSVPAFVGSDQGWIVPVRGAKARALRRGRSVA
jgi:hypothetical protein